MIEVNNLVKKFGSYVAVNDASFTIEDGEVVGFLGPNGAGKTTTMNILTGYLSATSGSIKIDGFDILDDPSQAKRRIGYLPEHPPLYIDMTVDEYLNFVYNLKKTRLPRKPHIAEICRLVRIQDVQNRLIRNLSKGYRQRVGIAQALIGNPDVLILDEPTVGLDPKQIIEIRNLITQLGKTHTIILSSHILSEIQAVCKRIIVINHGYLIADDTADNLSRSLADGDNLLLMKIMGPAREVKSQLEQMNGVRGVRVLGAAEADATAYSVEPAAGTEIRPQLFGMLAEKNWPLIELKTSGMTLEDIFLNLVEQPPEETAALYQKRKAQITNNGDVESAGAGKDGKDAQPSASDTPSEKEDR